jgi:hypothetical protein
MLAQEMQLNRINYRAIEAEMTPVAIFTELEITSIAKDQSR